jgi:hypothetical protein
MKIVHERHNARKSKGKKTKIIQEPTLKQSANKLAQLSKEELSERVVRRYKLKGKKHSGVILKKENSDVVPTNVSQAIQYFSPLLKKPKRRKPRSKAGMNGRRIV